MRKAFLTPTEILERVEPFVGGRTGLIGSSMELPLTSGNPEVCVYSSYTANLNQLSDDILILSEDGLALSGAGSSTNRTLARTKAFCEALERYCTATFNGKDVIVATRDELGESAVDLRLFARGSAAEYQHPRNYLVAPSNQERMRWVQGYSLITGEPTWVPMAAVYLSSPFQYPGEAFTLPITTGCALAASYEQATISGICEVIERDALMLTWLQQLPLPQIDVSGCQDPGFWDRMARVERAGIQQYFFDATTDLGVSTVYALQIAPDSDLAVLVMAATRLDPAQAISKVIDEASSGRLALEQLRKQPPPYDADDFYTFTTLTAGAIYYGDAGNMGAFDFLLNHEQKRPLAAMPNLATGNPETELDRLISIFRRLNLDLYVVDITIPQLRDVGLYVVKVVAPQLLPLATNYCMRYTAAPRLYEAPARMGHPVRDRAQLNPLPQPFA
ncbi:MAG: YcaO-like family protein [Anaerolineales bacterium]|nr:YcaO-like family protein [Anaerolineales bacterium]